MKLYYKSARLIYSLYESFLENFFDVLIFFYTLRHMMLHCQTDACPETVKNGGLMKSVIPCLIEADISHFYLGGCLGVLSLWIWRCAVWSTTCRTDLSSADPSGSLYQESSSSPGSDICSCHIVSFRNLWNVIILHLKLALVREPTYVIFFKIIQVSVLMVLFYIC